MHVDGVGLLPPGLTGIFEVANQFFFLGIDTDDGIAGRDKALFLGRNIAKLRVPIGIVNSRSRCKFTKGDANMTGVDANFPVGRKRFLSSLHIPFQACRKLHNRVSEAFAGSYKKGIDCTVQRECAIRRAVWLLKVVTIDLRLLL